MVILKTCSSIVLILLAAISSAIGQEQSHPIPPAIGPSVNLRPDAFQQTPTFHGTDKIVMTHDFYWYDIDTQAHILNSDGTDALTTHPATMDGFSYKSIKWHKQQLSDMIDAGIDVVLPVYWGAPSEQASSSSLHWSFAGLTPLVKAANQLISEGKKPPAIGLFYDTSTLQNNSWGVHVDLTTDYGRRWFYASIRDFFSLIPPRHWALIDGRPIIVLYGAGFAQAHNQGCIDFVKSEFPRQFGGRIPYIIREVSWRVKADNVYAWGGAIAPNFRGIAEIGPGYDHSAVPGRDPLVVSRRDGKFYQQAWLKVLRRSPQIVIIETWNEFHEGTSIAESREHGRQYINMTRCYADQFKRRIIPPAPEGPYRGAKSVKVVLGQTNQEHGIKQIEHEDGHTTPTMIADQACRASRPSRATERYLYFQIDDSFKWTRAMDAVIAVEFHDHAGGSFTIQYDSHDSSATLDGAYKDCPERIALRGTNTWKTARFTLDHARFDGSQNAGADFRLAVNGPEFHVRHVEVIRNDRSSP